MSAASLGMPGLGRALRHALVAVAGLAFLTPLLVAAVTSLKSPAEIGAVMALPTSPHLENYVIGWVQIRTGLANSLLITGPAVVLSVLVGCIAAYPLAMMRATQTRWVYFFLLTGMFVPFQIVQIPLFFMIRGLGLYNTIPGMWLVHMAYGIPVCTFFMRNFFSTVPRSFYEAAQIDGCSTAAYFMRILLPCSLPGLAALAIVQSRAIWNDLLFAMTLTSSDAAIPVTAQLNQFVGATSVQYGPLMASTLISILPVLIAYLAFQKAFVRGLLGGGVK
jgi:glucose/mannose transport system permease protein